MLNDGRETPMAALDGSALRQRLKRAIALGHIWPAFQPIMDMHTESLAGFEILARWSDPEQGEIGPVVFIPQLERHGLIGILSDALMERACREAAGWPDHVNLAFNISPLQLVTDRFPRHVARLVERTGFPLENVEIEVTETSLFTDEDKVYAILRKFDALGMRIAIDDFGTGYSSLARLESFPFRKLKIDARFVRSIDREAGTRRIAAAVIGLGQSLGVTVIAEGVETEAEEAVLKSYGCDLGQGWLYGKAMPACEARRILEKVGVAKTGTRGLDASPFQQLHQLASLYHQAPVGLCFLDLDFRHVRTNARFAGIHGLKASQLEGRTIREAMDADMAGQAEELLRESMASQDTCHRQFRLQGKDVIIFVSRVTDVDGTNMGFSLISIDITEQMSAIRALADSEEHHRRLVHLNPDIAWSAGADGVFDYISPTTQDAPDETMRSRIERWYGRIHPQDIPRLREKWFGWLGNTEPYAEEFRLLDSSGNYRWVRSMARPHIDANGRIVRWYGLTKDITELKELRMKLAALDPRETQAKES